MFTEPIRPIHYRSVCCYKSVSYHQPVCHYYLSICCYLSVSLPMCVIIIYQHVVIDQCVIVKPCVIIIYQYVVVIDQCVNTDKPVCHYYLSICCCCQSVLPSTRVSLSSINILFLLISVCFHHQHNCQKISGFNEPECYKHSKSSGIPDC